MLVTKVLFRIMSKSEALFLPRMLFSCSETQEIWVLIPTYTSSCFRRKRASIKHSYLAGKSKIASRILIFSMGVNYLPSILLGANLWIVCSTYTIWHLITNMYQCAETALPPIASFYFHDNVSNVYFSQQRAYYFLAFGKNLLASTSFEKNFQNKAIILDISIMALIFLAIFAIIIALTESKFIQF